MRPEELRIGNYVSYACQDTIVLDVLRSHCELCYFTDSIGFERKYNEFTPLELTEDNIVKLCDFRYTADGQYIKQSDIFELNWDKETGLYLFIVDSLDSAELDYIKYVHQVQNLVLDLIK